MLLFGIDLETTSVDTKTAQIVEVGWALYDTNFNQIVDCGSRIISPRFLSGVNYSEVENITGISEGMISKYGVVFGKWYEEVFGLIAGADFFVAHNGNSFDRPIFERHLTIGGDAINNKPWIDTLRDIPFSFNVGSKSLINLCAVHGFLNPFPHRALFDVASMLKLLSLYDLTEIIRRASSPIVWLRALVSIENKEKAKKRHYIWDKVNRFWVKQIKDFEKETEVFEADFETTTLNGYEYERNYL
jgi:DNA polymerase-3 subunit epsilon